MGPAVVEDRLRYQSEAAVIDSVVLWLDLATRRVIVPPTDLRNIWLRLARTEDFAWLD